MLPLLQSDTSIKGFTLCQRCDRLTQISMLKSQSVFQVSSSLPVLGFSSHWHHAHSWHRAA